MSILEKNIEQLLTEIEEKQAEATRKIQEIRRSLEIKKLWPEAFDHGVCSSHVIGNLNEPHYMEFQLQNAKHRRLYSLDEMPDTLFRNFCKTQLPFGGEIPHRFKIYAKKRNVALPSYL